MDVAAFSEDNFEVKEWINKTFRSTEAQENRDAFVSSLVMKLQLYVQQVNSALEDTSQQVLQSLPRIMRDTEVLQQEAMLLREKMQLVKSEIAKVEQDTGQSIATLEHIDQIKTELQSAKQALHEADNWTVLAADLEEVFESGDIESIARKLTSMQQSLQILASVPDYEDRKLQLEGLKNRLEAMASPLLVQAFTTGSVDESRMFVRIFSAMDRLPQLLKYYHKCQKGVLVKQWRGIVELEQDEGLTDWMAKLYDSLLSNWHDQVKWGAQVFSGVSPIGTLLELYADTLGSLEPSLNVCIDAALKQHADQLFYLIRLKELTKGFATNLQVAVESTAQGRAVSQEAMLPLAEAVFFPFIPYVSKYALLEQAVLSRQLAALECRKEELVDTVQGLGQSIPRAMLHVSEAGRRCLRFTEGCGYSGLLYAVKVFLGSYLDQYRVTLRRLQQSKRQQEDWGLFQMCLTLLQTVGELLGRVKQLEAELAHSILDSSRKLQQERNPFTRYKCLLLSPAGRKEFESFVATVQEGEEMLLLEPMEALRKLCRDVHLATYQVIFAPISAQLELVQLAPAWSKQPLPVAPDLPDFSFVPQEYITQIGQYLMTLPQHLEPFLLRDNPSLSLALRECADAEGGLADWLLGDVARGTCHTYCDSILGICELSPGACKQLATDIDYLGNVLEDLGMSLTEHLQQLVTLLRLSPEEYQAKSSGCSPRLVAAVRQMRNITSS
ncbi:conserved oligomeric Golgi complex subunit 7 isoform X2 [Bacillus rossius redtenbacheri]|uniref:conserved oligomeric Golgi complex subunit 7 isoform X1 n=1 Tax=Bacillus rossius redtenbacheri TaxID=93214 RepID=UPI002FDC7B96